jgi:hypothetical protein
VELVVMPVRAGATVSCELTKTDALDREIEQLLALELLPA